MKSHLTIRCLPLLAMLLSGAAAPTYGQTRLPPIEYVADSQGFPPPPAEVTLDELVDLAMAHHPALLQAAADVEAASARAWQAGLRSNPVFNYDAGAIGDSGTAGTHGFFFDQQIIRRQTRALRSAAAEAEVAEWEWRRRAATFRVINDVQLRYFELLAIDQERQRHEEFLRHSQRVLQTAARLADNGQRGQPAEGRQDEPDNNDDGEDDCDDNDNNSDQASRPDVWLAEVEVERQRLALLALDSRYEAAWHALEAAIGVSHVPRSPLAGRLDAECPPLEWQPTLSSILEQHPDLQAARSAVSRFALATERERSEGRPNATFRIGAQYDFSQEETQGTFRFSLPLPVHDHNQGNIEAARSEFQRARLELERLQFDLTRRAARSYDRYRRNHQTVERYRNHIVPTTRRAMHAYFRRFEAREASYSDANSAREDYIARSGEYLDALLEMRRAEVLLRGALIEPDDGPPERTAGTGAR